MSRIFSHAIIGITASAALLLMVSPLKPAFAQSSLMYPVTSTPTVKVGQTFTVPLIIDPKGDKIDTVRVLVSYPVSMLQITNFSQGGLFPGTSPRSSYDNQAGTLNWGGFTTAVDAISLRGTFGTITFKAIKAGTATVAITGGSHLIYAGEERLVSPGSVTITIKDDAPIQKPTTPTPPTPVTPPKESPVEPAPADDVPPKTPYIYSPTHPDQDKWYSLDKATLQWGLEKGVTGVNILLDAMPWTDPGKRSDGIFGSYTYTDMEDGISFFHLRTANQKGWSPTSHYRLKIDSSAPTIDSFEETTPASPTESQFTITVSDSLSGIASRKISIDKQEYIVWEDDGSHIYTTPELEPGEHTVSILVSDNAGNKTEKTLTFVIKKPAFLPIINIIYPSALTCDADPMTLWFAILLGAAALVLLLLVLISLYNAIARRQKKEPEKKFARIMKKLRK